MATGLYFVLRLCMLASNCSCLQILSFVLVCNYFNDLNKLFLISSIVATHRHESVLIFSSFKSIFCLFVTPLKDFIYCSFFRARLFYNFLCMILLWESNFLIPRNDIFSLQLSTHILMFQDDYFNPLADTLFSEPMTAIDGGMSGTCRSIFDSNEMIVDAMIVQLLEYDSFRRG